MSISKLPGIQENVVFWDTPLPPGKIHTREQNMIMRNIEKKMYSYSKKREDGSEILSIDRYLLFNKYNYYVIIDDTKVETPGKKFIFKKKFRLPCHQLLLISDLDEIKTLPNELLKLYIQYSEIIFKFPVEVIPLGIVSLNLSLCNFPFNGKDLSHLKSLKIFSARGTPAQTLPIFPRCIEYIDFQNTSLGNGFGKGADDFHLVDYKRLKYFNVKDSHFTKKRKNIKGEWEVAKKLGQIGIWW